MTIPLMDHVCADAQTAIVNIDTTIRNFLIILLSF